MASQLPQVDHDEGGGGGGEEERKKNTDEEVYGDIQKDMKKNVNMRVECGMNGNVNSMGVLRMGSMKKEEQSARGGGHVEEEESNAQEEDKHRRIQEELAVVLATRDANTVATMV